MTKPIILMTGPYTGWDMPVIEQDYTLLKLWAADDRDSLIARHAADVRAIATPRRHRRDGAADRCAAEARDHWLLRGGNRRHRPGGGEGAWHPRHQHARGSVVDEEALIAALEQRRIRAAGLDVFLNAPRIDPRFLALDNVLLQPHHGSGTVETRKAMGQLVRDNLAAHFADRPLLTPVV